MLEALRRQSQSWLIWVALGIIIIVFIFFFGPQAGGFDPSQKTWAAKVRGQKVYNTELEAAVDRARQVTGRDVSGDNYFAVKRDVLLDMAMIHLLAEEARNEGLRISDDELSCYIVNWNQNYNVDGEYICRKFSRSYQLQYRNFDYMFYSDPDGGFSSDFAGSVRRWFALATPAYEAWKEQELLAFHYLDILAAGLPVDQASVAEIVSRRADKVDLEFIRLAPEESAEVEVTDAQVASFLATNEAEVRAYYEENIDEFTNEKQVRLRRLAIRKPGDPDSDEFAEAQERYEALLAEAQADGADFAALVEENTEFEQDRENGGDMGLRSESSITSGLWEAANGLDEGDVTGLEQGFAWNIIKLEEVVPAGETPFSEVREDIARTMLTERQIAEQTEQMRSRGERILAYAQQNNVTLEEALAATVPASQRANDTEQDGEEADGEEGAEETQIPAEDATDLSVATTGPFSFEPAPPDLSGIDPQFRQFVQIQSRDPGSLPQIGSAPQLVARAFQLTEDEPLIDEIVEVEGVPFLIRLNERSREEDAEKLSDDMASSLRGSLSGEWIAPVQTRLKLFLHNGAPFAPALQDLLDRALVSGDIEIREKLFPEGQGIGGMGE